MSVTVDIQHASEPEGSPSTREIQDWVRAATDTRRQYAEVSIRIVDEAEISELNRRYRHKDGPTNVLSFATDFADSPETPLLGDIVICAPVVAREAAQQQKTPLAHWAHMVIHGTLHLLGFDHTNEQDAEQMEALETEIMTKLQFPPPYQSDEQNTVHNHVALQ